jgi:putative ABC transport system permease protein
MKRIFDTDRWQEIWITITHNKSRSFLTAFGVFWGVLMLVLMVGAGNALQQGVSSQISGFATNSCFFWSNPTSVPYEGFRKGRRWDISDSDLPVLRQKVQGLEHLTPMLLLNGNVVRGERNGSFQIKGFYPEQNSIEESIMLHGRYVNDIDIAQRRKVCIIGERVSEVLFQNESDPTGQYIRINGIYFQVIGVSRNRSQASVGGSPEESIILPFTAMQYAFNQGNIVHVIAATAMPGVPVKAVQDQITDILRERHQVSPDDREAVGSMNVEEQFKMFYNLGVGIAALIWFVGLGTLLAGAIGVSNIMLVTVRERTKEIGIRRALGATPQNIIGQILTESAVLTCLAGLMAIVLGVGLLQLVGIVLSQADVFFKDPQISFTMAIGSLVILLIIGTLAGYAPAQRAMLIKPVEAIGEE